jgi:hypothetical protein
MAKMKFLFSIFLILLPCLGCLAQALPKAAEDSLNSSSQYKTGTTIGGYGNAFYRRDFQAKTAEMDLERFVLFVGHKFTKSLSVFSELEVEDAKVAGGEPGGEVAIEQAYLKLNIDKDHYFTAGLFLPRIGILNESHLPTTFNGNERTVVETYILPSTWRELGIGFYGNNINGFPINYSVALVNGLSSARFEHGSGIREGRFEGRNASANNLAITAACQFYTGGFKAQVSGYYGGTVGLAPKDADTLKLSAGTFSIPVIIGEADLQYSIAGFTAKLLGTVISIPDAFVINRAYLNNTPMAEYGGYLEVGYNIFQPFNKLSAKQFNIFARYEKLDMNYRLPANTLYDGSLNQSHFVTGLSYLPARNVILKADIHIIQSDNKDSPVNEGGPITILNLGVGYSF